MNGHSSEKKKPESLFTISHPRSCHVIRIVCLYKQLRQMVQTTTSFCRNNSADIPTRSLYLTISLYHSLSLYLSLSLSLFSNLDGSFAEFSGEFGILANDINWRLFLTVSYDGGEPTPCTRTCKRGVVCVECRVVVVVMVVVVVLVV